MKRLLKSVALGLPVLALSATAMAEEATQTATGLAEKFAPNAPFLAVACSVAALIMAVYFYKKMMSAPEGTETMIEIATHVREGAIAYLVRQYKVVAMVFVVLLAIFAWLAYIGVQNPFVPVAFLTGGLFSGLCGFLGMKTATNASARTAQGASESLNRGLTVAFRSGAVMGLVVVGFGLLDIALSGI